MAGSFKSLFCQKTLNSGKIDPAIPQLQREFLGPCNYGDRPLPDGDRFMPQILLEGAEVVDHEDWYLKGGSGILLRLSEVFRS